MSFFFNRRKRDLEVANTVRKADAIARVSKKRVGVANAELDKLNKLLNEARANDDVSLKIFIGIGGDRRMR